MNLDLAIIGTLVVLLTLYGVWKGRGMLISLGLALYPTALIYQHFPYLNQLTLMKQTLFQASVSHAVIFLIFLVLITWSLKTTANSYYTSKGIISTLLISLSLAGLLIAFEHQLPGLRNLHLFTPTISKMFLSETWYFIWLILPPIVVFFLR